MIFSICYYEKFNPFVFLLQYYNYRSCWYFSKNNSCYWSWEQDEVYCLGWAYIFLRTYLHAWLFSLPISQLICLFVAQTSSCDRCFSRQSWGEEEKATETIDRGPRMGCNSFFSVLQVMGCSGELFPIEISKQQKLSILLNSLFEANKSISPPPALNIFEFVYKSMLHELLFALLGKPGSIIKQYDQCFKVDPAATVLNQAEADMISGIAQSGYYYLHISKFIEAEITEISFADPTKNPSVYRKAMAQGLRIALQEYEALIFSFQRNFRQSKHFTFGNIKAQITKYLLIMKDIWDLVQKIVNEKYRGGVIIDIFWQAFQKGSLWMRDWAEIVLKECEKVFVNQVIAWIAHGQLIDVQGEFFIHKVIHEPEEKIQFTQLSSKNIEMTGWDIYTLDSELIPLTIVSQQTAGKILFIGKSVKILKSSGKISAIPSDQILLDIRALFQQDYSQILFESIIQKIRKAIAEQMIKLIIGQQNLLRQLQKINDYYLMLKGDFYHHFLEETKCIQLITSKEKAQKKINQTCLQNTFVLLNNNEDAKRISFELKALGFSYVGFKNFMNICPVGNIDLVEGKYIRFSSSGGGIWHRTKQVVENNFTVMFSLSFKRTKTMFKTRRQDLKQRISSIISLVIQNQKDISPSFHENPATVAKLNEYVSINIGYRYSQDAKNYESIINVTYKNQKKYTKQMKIGELIPKKINFLDQGVYFIKIAYQYDELKISVSPMNSYESQEQNSFKIDQIRLSSYLNLEMNRASIGILSNIQDFNCQAEVEQWEMICKPNNHHGDHWSDLSLKMTIPWPLNLILTQDLMEIFSRINKFLFPVRQIQIELERIWMRIPRRFKEAKHITTDPLELKELFVFERKIAATRSRISMVINNLWAYFQSDVVQTAWQKLKQSISQSDDFQDVIRMITRYANTIQTMFYFNALKIQRNMHEIVRQARNFASFFNKLQNENVIDSRTIKEYENIDDNLRKNVSDFSKLLKQLSKTNNSAHLFHLTQRIEGCVEQNNQYAYF